VETIVRGPLRRRAHIERVFRGDAPVPSRLGDRLNSSRKGVIVHPAFAILALLPLGVAAYTSPGSGATTTIRAQADTNAARRDSLMNVVLDQIKGREQLPAESVFKNIKTFKGAPAGRIPRLMNLGYGRSLGVGCSHCHVVGEWDKDDKPQKQVARDMAAMVVTINTQLLPNIKNLKSEQPLVNCTTCHRGDVKPAINLPAEPGLDAPATARTYRSHRVNLQCVSSGRESCRRQFLRQGE
jgi:hypothetical protein